MRIEYNRPEGPYYKGFQYPGGELQIRLTKHGIQALCEEQGAVQIVARIRTPEHLIGLCLLADAVMEVVQGRVPVDLILPYLPYARADRRFVDGDCYGLKTFGTIIDGLGFDHVITLDAHSPKAKKLIGNLVDVSPASLIEKVRLELNYPMVVLPDEGASRYGFDTHAVRGTKHRNQETGVIESFTLDRPTLNRRVLVVDDICDGGATFIKLAEAMPSAKERYLYVTHGIFSKGIGVLQEHYRHLYCSDSFENPYEGHPDVTVLPTRELLK